MTDSMAGRRNLKRAVRMVLRGGAKCACAGPIRFVPLIAWLTISATAFAQTSGESATRDHQPRPLTRKQQMIHERFKRFEDRLFRLQEELRELEPQNAARLERVIRQAGVLELADRLREIGAKLDDPSALTDALEDQSQWVRDADRLLTILVERRSDLDEIEREIDRLRAYKANLDEILGEQRALQTATEQSALARRTAERLEEMTDRLDGIIDRQSDLLDSTDDQSAGEGVARLKEEQGELAADVSDLADDVDRMGGQRRHDDEDEASGLPADETLKDAARALREASRAMSEAGGHIEQTAPAKASDAQRLAIEQLRQARRRLEEARQFFSPDDAGHQTADQQRDLADRTQELGEQARRGDSENETPPVPGQPDDALPGGESVDRAAQRMRDAQEQLQEDRARDALGNQERAINELEQAQEALEQVLNQLRKEEREETLRDIEQRFRDMLSRQRTINATTVALDRLGMDHFTRAEELQLADLATRQRELSDEAGTCLHILDEEGTTLVFPRVMAQVTSDMDDVADRLGNRRIGVLTQRIEREIIDALQQMVEAVQRMQRENEQQASGGRMRGDGEDPLLPVSAELKLLRSSQVRINERTVAIEQVRAEGDDGVESALDTVAQRQTECAEIVRTMQERREH